MSNARSVDTGSYLHPNSWSVVSEGANLCTLYISMDMEVGSHIVLINPTRRSVNLRVENDFYPLATANSTAVDHVEAKAGDAIMGVLAWSATYQSLVMVCSVVTEGTPSPGPDGDWLPKNNPAFTGTLSSTDGTLDVSSANGDGTPSQVRIDGTRVSMREQELVQLNADRVVLEGRQAGEAPTASFEILNGQITVDSAYGVDINTARLNMLVSDNAGNTSYCQMYPYSMFWQTNQLEWKALSNGKTTSILMEGGLIEMSENPILLGTLAVADLPDMALITKGQIWDVLNGVYAHIKGDETDGGGIVPGPALARVGTAVLPSELRIGSPSQSTHFVGLTTGQTHIETDGVAMIAVQGAAPGTYADLPGPKHYHFTFVKAGSVEGIDADTWYIG